MSETQKLATFLVAVARDALSCRARKFPSSARGGPLARRALGPLSVGLPATMKITLFEGACSPSGSWPSPMRRDR
jgi:hypothetical protein